ncbi:o-succinylbenzoate--CoA ligase [Alginatibacterium sediminis]|uniref:O-succinylbenzoate--CoA ligase n=1 Tax=Alginatibacterium sediminis TaxID=2164068 RepID=A0A420E7A2_9ALTE|nr:o-succinylbenzoate--CoA ligase [Alginatibacterium sediminis]RKF14298.1 o-succinylbenzoate--CoA ligase [Alginatibacterium sediminis]
MTLTPIAESPLWLHYLRQPDAIALQLSNVNYSYRQLSEMVARIIAQLQQQGLKPGDRIVCISERQLIPLLLQLACLHLGTIFCPLNQLLRPQQLSLLVKNLDANSGYFEKSSFQCAQQVLELDPFQGEFSLEELQVGLHCERPLSMVHTSGSSALPKAAVHCWKNHYFSALGSQAVIPLSKNERWLLSLPLYHIGGLAIVWRCLLAGATVVLGFHLSPLIEQLKQQSVSHISLVPTQLYRLLTAKQFLPDRLKLKHILVGGAPCADTLLDACVERGFSVYSSYGSTEMSSQIATRNHQSLSAGYQILPHRRVKLLDDEILVKGACLFMGYWQNGRVIARQDEMGWFHSGDIGQLLGNFLQVNGRCDNMFVSGGENIQPEEIESLLYQQSEIEQAFIVAQRDAEYGQRPVLFYQSTGDITLQQVRDYLKPHLPSLKVPIASYPLPRVEGLKHSRKNLAELANQYSQQHLDNV